jgi:hypothetical protein
MGLALEKAQPGRLIPRPRSRTARPLKPAQVDALIAGYRAGTSMEELEAEFGIDRRTVSTHLRAGVVIRRGGLDQAQAAEAAGLYEAGADRVGSGSAHHWGRMSVESICW